jgi:hypothetical protein
MVFGAGGALGNPGTLFLTAGGGTQPNFPAGGSTTSVFASVVPAAAVTSANFSLSLSSPSVTLASGGSANVSVSAAAVGGFNSPISLSCAASAGLTCAFNPATINAGSTAGSTLTVSAATAVPPMGYGFIFLLPSLGLFGSAFAFRRKRVGSKSLLAMMGLVFLASSLSFFTVGCGGGSSVTNTATTPTSQSATLMVTGTSGSLTQSSSLTVKIN